ncbi:hypothetical protein ACIGBH_25060 [Streptomyces sp. NPDC085929]|uniref:hypothetical protein n=1 Tax=Streptomyces sp. NPDC085929 TaxID=3365739 RepID=UPI0037CDE90B
MRLRTSRPDRPGCTRRRAGSGFRFIDSEGHRLTDEPERVRLRALAIPPAWKDFWICPLGERAHPAPRMRPERCRRGEKRLRPRAAAAAAAAIRHAGESVGFRWPGGTAPGV